ncbi:MAG: phosphate transport regulator [Geobacteraceae bacterium GWC2_53_11]|nr:MAG: phosphate transport regulator [Geobacteraceae bacterium GWC2_53_11]
MFGLIPKEEKFFAMFQEMGQIIVSGAERLKLMMDDYDNPAEGQRAVKDIEHQGDVLKHKIIKMLNTTFITPLDREDIYGLATALDSILNLIDASAQRFVMYRVEQPTTEAKELVFIIVRCCHTLSSALNHLGKCHDDIHEQCVELNSLENEADNVCREAISRLFDEETDPIQLIKWKEIYEILERTTDRCEDAANILESVVVKNA